MSLITLIVNEEEQTIEVDGDTPLLWVLRDKFNLTGVKYSCGIGECGACTVHVDGQATRSCITPISAVAGKHITTIEGLSPDGSHPIQRAWITEQVPQCGYCQPGQIMTAVDLLKRIPNPTDEEISQVMSGVLCRCGTYPRILKAIHRAMAEGGAA